MKQRQGFTTVELLVSIVVGVLLLGSGYQLYLVATKDSGDAQRQSRANAAAYDLLRQAQSKVTRPCATIPNLSGLTTPSYANLPEMNATTTISCPYILHPNVSQITTTVTYKNERDGAAQSVTRSILVNRNE